MRKSRSSEEQIISILKEQVERSSRRCSNTGSVIGGLAMD